MDREWLKDYIRDNHTDVSEHLLRFHDIAVGMNAHKVLEIGVRSGESTRAFLTAMLQTGGHLVSVDIEPTTYKPPEEALGHWTFVQGDSATVPIPHDSYDIVFIDGDHSFEATIKDLERVTSLLKQHGAIFLHDVLPIPGFGALEAVVRVMICQTTEPWFFSIIQENCGMGVLFRKHGQWVENVWKGYHHKNHDYRSTRDAFSPEQGS